MLFALPRTKAALAARSQRNQNAAPPSLRLKMDAIVSVEEQLFMVAKLTRRMRLPTILQFHFQCRDLRRLPYRLSQSLAG
jgi:hypothetical protein